MVQPKFILNCKLNSVVKVTLLFIIYNNWKSNVATINRPLVVDSLKKLQSTEMCETHLDKLHNCLPFVSKLISGIKDLIIFHTD